MPVTISMIFRERLAAAWRAHSSLLCVGLDPDARSLPLSLRPEPGASPGAIAERIVEFNARIIEATADLTAAFKPQYAFYGALGAPGVAALSETFRLIRALAPHALALLDAKRGDVGHTAQQYASEAFNLFGADAVTVNPYLGHDSVEPFLRDPVRGAFLVCRTSNPGARDFQDLAVGHPPRPLFAAVAEAVSGWNSRDNCGLVVGATYPDDLRLVRRLAPTLPILVPGIGAQGGDLEASVRAGLDGAGAGLLISASRSVLYASHGSDFEARAREAATALRLAINRARGA